MLVSTVCPVDQFLIERLIKVFFVTGEQSYAYKKQTFCPDLFFAFTISMFLVLKTEKGIFFSSAKETIKKAFQV